MRKFDPDAFGKTLDALQKRKGVTNESLANRAGISVRNVERLRSGKDIKRPPKEATLERLAKALDTSVAVLLGDAPLPQAENQVLAGPLTDLGFKSFTLLLSPEQRNALGLVSLRYGVSPTFVLKLSALTFEIVARMSQRARTEAIEEIDRRHSALAEMKSRLAHLPISITAPHTHHDLFIAAEERSIRANDLFADMVREDEGLAPYWLGDEFDAPNPFHACLARLAHELGCGAEVMEVERAYDPRFTILRDEALRLTCGDEDLADLILSGTVMLAGFPRKLLSDDHQEERLRWLREKLEARAGSLEGFDLGLDDEPTSPDPAAAVQKSEGA